MLTFSVRRKKSPAKLRNTVSIQKVKRLRISTKYDNNDTEPSAVLVANTKQVGKFRCQISHCGLQKLIIKNLHLGRHNRKCHR